MYIYSAAQLLYYIYHTFVSHLYYFKIASEVLHLES